MTNPEANPKPATAAFPICSQLRSKKYFFLDGPPRSAAEITDGSCHFWCARTHQALGPDHFAVAPSDCDATRECFRPIFPSLT